MTTTAEFPTLSSRGKTPKTSDAFGEDRKALPPDTIHLTGGVPGGHTLPAAQLAEAYHAVLSQEHAGAKVLPYSNPYGIDPLREWLGQDQGVDPEQVVITNGGLHSISLALENLIDPGDTIYVESLSFPFALRIFSHYKARILSVPLDHDGIDVDALEAQLKAGPIPKILYVIPDFHNPSGYTLTAERRTRILELAEKYGFLILSDNPYKKLGFEGQSVPDFDSASGWVLHANTFSKSLGPGLRIGWLVTPLWLRDSIIQTRITTDQHQSLVTQNAVVHLVNTPGLFDSVVTKARASYKEQADTFYNALSERLRDRFEAERPNGGLFLWARLKGIAANTLLPVARSKGVDFVAGPLYDPTHGTEYNEYVRFSYSQATPTQLTIAADRLAAAVDQIS